VATIHLQQRLKLIFTQFSSRNFRSIGRKPAFVYFKQVKRQVNYRSRENLVD